MTEKNHAASVRARLLNLSRAQGDDFFRLFLHYGNERLLYRLSQSPYADQFVLKGATLFALWLGKPHRATKDLDLLGRGDPDIGRMVRLFREIVAIPCPEDGLVFDAAGIEGEPIREEARYIGVRVTIPAMLAGARMKLQVDVGMGDAVVPAPIEVEMPPLLALPAARLRAYRREVVVAEKLEALVTLGLTNSRLKDFYDLDLLRRTFAFDATLAEAVTATFQRRGTPPPTELPIGLSDAFAADETKQAQWRAFVRKAGVKDAPKLAEVVSALRTWLWPLLQGAAHQDEPAQ